MLSLDLAVSLLGFPSPEWLIFLLYVAYSVQQLILVAQSGYQQMC